MLVIAAAWQIERYITHKNDASMFVAARHSFDENERTISTSTLEGLAVSNDVVSYIGPAVLGQLTSTYDQMLQDGSFSLDDAQKAAESLAASLTAPVEYATYRATDLSIDPDTSYERMLRYRSDLRTALTPLLENTQAEYETFALYVETGDHTHLAQLRTAAQRYRDAQSAMARMSVPRDAAVYHLAIVDALGKFAATLDSMSTHADDPFAAVALLRTYNQAEADVLTSFGALPAYYKTKTP